MIIDALDTMHIMGLTSEYEHAKSWIADSLSFDRSGFVSAFEVTIRVLGGLLSAYYLSHDPLFLDKAVDLADRIMPIFATPSGIPLSSIDLKERVGQSDTDNNGWSSLSEVATLQLELKYLSHLTDDYTYWRAAEKVRHHVTSLVRVM
jgi:mannosyl-oligosaccharide alpha-1,2-mannosidase